MAEEEFQESDVVFDECADGDPAREGRWRRKPSSPPLSIPMPRNPWLHCVEVAEIDDDDGEMVPPHVIVGRRVAGKVTAFSICSGKAGRTLKGRDLNQVRNAILRMTGFLET